MIICNIRIISIIRFDTTCCLAVISDNEDVTCKQHNPEHEDMPDGYRTEYMGVC